MDGLATNMRIIAGEYRGRRLLGPADANTTRPITDRVKQALFDRLSARRWLGDVVVLDLFSGTGSMGLECLSRGAGHVTFVERDREARRRLDENLRTLKVGNRATVLETDALGMGWMAAVRGPVELIFVDPPYRMMEGEDRVKVQRQMKRLAGMAKAGACMVLRVEKHTTPPGFSPEVSPGVTPGFSPEVTPEVASEVEMGWNEPMVYPYGSMAICFYVKGR